MRRALIDLYFSTNSNRTWSGCDETACKEARCEGKVRWVSQEHYCTWKCVSCDANHAVTGLFLAHNRMSGTIPASVSWISSLQTLDVSENAQLAGTLPASLGGNSALQTLAFNNTQISGTLPAALSRAESLRSVAAGALRKLGEHAKQMKRARSEDAASAGQPAAPLASKIAKTEGEPLA